MKASAAWLGSTSILALAICAGFDARVAHACGGCFHAATDTNTSVVTDHRMVLAISTRQTVLWDQIRYSGTPSEFAWVLPVRPGARIELARGEFVEALDLATQVSVKGPDISCVGTGSAGPSNGGTSSSSGGSAVGRSSSGGGCGFSSATTSATPTLTGTPDDGTSGTPPRNGSTSFESDGGVEVVAQSVVGPYQAVTLRSSQGDALDRWLDANGFETPDSVVPVISAYAREGFDFIALKLRPGVNVRSMRPVRVVTPGASPVLPLRMVTAGIGAKVGLALWVISEGRWETQSFPNAIVDSSRIAWNNTERRSNYRELAAEALRAENGRVWLTEYSARNYDGGFAKELYRGACVSLPMVKVSCEGSSTDLPWDAGAPDAQVSTDAAVDAEPDADTDAGTDAGPDDASAPDAAAPCTVLKKACDVFDDFDTALAGLHANDVWITKLRAELTPKDCASADLSLAAARSQSSVSNTYSTDKFTNPTFDPCAGMRSPNGSTSGTTVPSSSSDDRSGCACKLSAIGEALPPEPIALGAVGVLAALRLARRRKR